MPTFETVRVAAIQATPVVLDAEASVAKARTLLGEAAAAGAPRLFHGIGAGEDLTAVELPGVGRVGWGAPTADDRRRVGAAAHPRARRRGDGHTQL